MVFEFRLGKAVRIIHCESVCRYPLAAVRVCCTKLTDRAWVISKCVDLRRQQTERCLGWFIGILLVLRCPHGLFTRGLFARGLFTCGMFTCGRFTREHTRLLTGSSSTSTGSCLARELFCQEGWTRRSPKFRNRKCVALASKPKLPRLLATVLGPRTL